jgi:hypothetical protein
MSKPTRNLWPTSIVVFFVLAITFIISFIVWAVRQRDDLVSADYYEREVRYQAQLDTLNRSQALAVTTVVTFEPAQQTIVITLPSPRRRARPAAFIFIARPMRGWIANFRWR